MSDSQRVRVFGARVSRPGSEGTILVEQTSREHPGTGNNPYTIDQNEEGRNISRFVDFDNDAGIAQAIRDAVQGIL